MLPQVLLLAVFFKGATAFNPAQPLARPPTLLYSLKVSWGMWHPFKPLQGPSHPMAFTDPKPQSGTHKFIPPVILWKLNPRAPPPPLLPPTPPPNHQQSSLPTLPDLDDRYALTSSHGFSDEANWLIPGKVLVSRYPGVCSLLWSLLPADREGCH